MTITPVDQYNDLFFVEDLYPSHLLDIFCNHNHLQTSHKKEEWQDKWPRRRLVTSPNSVYEQMHTYVQSILPNIEQNVATTFLACDTGFWLDLPGFDMQKHIDNDGVYAAMQIYLTENSQDMPTVFYNENGSVRFKPDYRLNSGYFMLNNKKQWHAMPYTVPENEYRLTSYTWFYKK